MTTNVELRAQTRDELVDGIDERRAELQRRADEALEGLKKAFGPREAQPEKRGPGRPKGPRIVLGNEAPRGDLDNEGEGDEALQ